MLLKIVPPTGDPLIYDPVSVDFHHVPREGDRVIIDRIATRIFTVKQVVWDLSKNPETSEITIYLG
jgi:hypothetical protein